MRIFGNRPVDWSWHRPPVLSDRSRGILLVVGVWLVLVVAALGVVRWFH